MSASLVLGGVELHDEFPPNEWRFSVLGEDMTFGNPQPVEMSIASLMADGSPTVTTHHENREAGFRVTISGPDSGALSSGERELNLQLTRRNTLAWTPADGFGPTTVFEVETSNMDWLFDDTAEAEGKTLLRRTFRLRLVCLPFPRSADVTLIGGQYVSESLVVDDDCESATGWSMAGQNVSGTAAFTVDSTAGNFATGTGSVKMVITPNKYGGGVSVPFGNSATYQTGASKAGLSISAAAGGYLSFRVRVDSPWTLDAANAGRYAEVTTSNLGRFQASAVAASVDDAGFIRFSLPMDASWGTVTALHLPFLSTYFGAPAGAQPANPVFRFDSIGHSAQSSSPQGAQTVEIGGSARSEAAITVSGAQGLGDVLVYTTPADRLFRPDLRRFNKTGNLQADAKSISGQAVRLSTQATFEAPATMFTPGAHAILMYARNGAGSGTTISATTITAQLFSGGVAVGPVETITKGAQSVPDYEYHAFSMDVLNLPTTVVGDNSTAVVRFTVNGGGDTNLDELLAFPLQDSALTWVNCGHGTTSASVASHLWIDAPAPTNPNPRILVGTNENRTDARAVVPKSRGRHLMTPGEMLIYVLTGLSGAPEVLTAYYKRWHSNAAE